MATIAEKSRTKEIIDRLQGILNNASPVPLAAGKVTIYKDEVQSLLDELAMQMEAELKTYHEVNDRRGKIINEAKKEAEKIIYQAEHSASRMRVSKRSTNVAPLDYSTLSEEEIASLGSANEIYAASLIYTDEMLTEVSKVIEDAYNNIRSDYEIVMQVFEEKMNTIISNKDELMSGLQEMDTADRSQQILEIGQLLSNELYNERMKQRLASDEYEDGSVQLTLDLQVEKAEESARAAEAMAEQTAKALEQMTAERNALMETVMKMEQEQLQAKQAEKMSAGAVNAMSGAVTGAVKNKPAVEDEEEYEIVYVTEDELEEGEEYEIEYVDDDEYEEGVEYEIEYVTEDELEEGEEYEIEYVDDEEIPEKASETATKKVSEKESGTTPEKASGKEVGKESEKASEKTKGSDEAVTQRLDTKEVKEAIRELNNLKKEEEGTPVIPHFKSSEKIASAPSEQIARMAKAVTTEKKYSGLIGRAVANREKAEAAVTVEETDSMMKAGSTEPAGKNKEESKTSNNSHKKQHKERQAKGNVKEQKKTAANESKKDDDIKTDDKGNQYVQATMQFDDDFEIMEF